MSFWSDLLKKGRKEVSQHITQPVRSSYIPRARDLFNNQVDNFRVGIQTIPQNRINYAQQQQNNQNIQKVKNQQIMSNIGNTIDRGIGKIQNFNTNLNNRGEQQNRNIFGNTAGNILNKTINVPQKIATNFVIRPFTQQVGEIVNQARGKGFTPTSNASKLVFGNKDVGTVSQHYGANKKVADQLGLGKYGAPLAAGATALGMAGSLFPIAGGGKSKVAKEAMAIKDASPEFKLATSPGFASFGERWNGMRELQQRNPLLNTLRKTDNLKSRLEAIQRDYPDKSMSEIKVIHEQWRKARGSYEEAKVFQNVDNYKVNTKGVKINNPWEKKGFANFGTPLSNEAKQYDSTLNAKAIREFGTTNVPESVGFVTPEGKLIDSSGKRQGSMAEGRNIDHREIASFSTPDNKTTQGMSGSDVLSHFMDKSGSTRISVNGDTINVDTLSNLTDSQLSQIERLSRGKTIYADISRTDGSVAQSGEFKTFSEYKNFIDKNFPSKGKLKGFVDFNAKIGKETPKVETPPITPKNTATPFEAIQNPNGGYNVVTNGSISRSSVKELKVGDHLDADVAMGGSSEKQKIQGTITGIKETVSSAKTIGSDGKAHTTKGRTIEFTDPFGNKDQINLGVNQGNINIFKVTPYSTQLPVKNTPEGIVGARQGQPLVQDKLNQIPVQPLETPKTALADIQPTSLLDQKLSQSNSSFDPNITQSETNVNSSTPLLGPGEFSKYKTYLPDYGGVMVHPKTVKVTGASTEKSIPIIFKDFATKTTPAGNTLNITNKSGQMIPADIQHAIQNGKDKSVLGLLRESPLRNIEDVFGNDGGQKINDYLVRPVAQNETNRVKWVANEVKQLQDNVISKIGKKNGLNDQLAFDYAEGKLTLNELKAKTADWQSVKGAADFGRSKYDEYLGLINKTLEKYGYTPIPKRADYVTHIQQIDGFFNQFGSMMNMNKDKLPTVMSSIHTTTRPGKTWFSFAQPRKGGEYDKSLIGAMDAYLPKASEQIFHTDSVQRARLLQKTVEGSVTDMADRQLSNFNSWLGQYANKLSGKASELDRSAEKLVGRGVLKASSWAKSRVGSNMVGANVSSALTNFIPLTQSLSTTEKPAAIRGLMEAVTSPFSKPGTIDGVESKFLTRRFTDTSLFKNTGQKVSEGVSSLFKAIDRFTSESVVRGKYYEGLKQGLSKSQAITRADEYAARIITDRSMGQMPVLFDSKTLGMFTQFQAEVNNQLSFIFKDIPKMSNGNHLKTASALAQVALYSYLYNQISEKVTGRRPAFDPVGVIQNGYEDYKSGNKNATKNLVDNIANQLPFVSTFTGGGRIPLSAAFPDIMGVINGTTTAKKEALKPLTYLVPPTGGGQISKTVQGVKAYMQGASINGSGNVRYPIPKTPTNAIKTGLFGQYSTPEATNYFRTGQTALSDKQSQLFKAGAKTYQDFMTERQQNAALDSLKSGKSTKGTQDLGNGLYQVGSSFYSKTLDQTFNSEEKANVALNKDKVEKSGKSMMVIDGMVYKVNKNGDAQSPITESSYNADLMETKKTSLKNSGDIKGWIDNADKLYANYQQQLQDPTLDEAEALKIQNKMDVLQKEADKYTSYNGFTKPESAAKVKENSGITKLRAFKTPTFKVSSGYKPTVKATRVTAAQLASGR